MIVPAKYENGVFRPIEKVEIKEGTTVEVYVPAEPSIQRPRSVGDSAFAGMWKDREDKADSVGYVNVLRRERHR